MVVTNRRKSFEVFQMARSNIPVNVQNVINNKEKATHKFHHSLPFLPRTMVIAANNIKHLQVRPGMS